MPITTSGARLLALMLAAFACGTAVAGALGDCACATVYDPVCGADGRTYGNACEASCAGVVVAYPGKCADPSGCAAVLCADIYAPVCGANNVTYPNECQAACTGVTIVGKGECGATEQPHGHGGQGGSGPRGGPACACPRIYRPVCGSDGKTYGNECLAKCAGAGVSYPGNCANPAGCAAVLCPADYTPVCGADGVTYPNECQATCTGVTIIGKGECEAADQTQSSGEVVDSPKPLCACPRIYRPVCGSDGKTYDNDCLAKCAEASVAYFGKCADPAGCAAVLCADIYAPVCGANNVTYPNECQAACTGVTIVGKGECGASGSVPGSEGEGGVGPACACPRILAPVCGSDGNTYDNECIARCSRVNVAYQGNCADPAGCAAVSCAAIYDPVCGADNVTYSNDCTASCTGVTIVSKGECGAPGSTTGSDGEAGLDPACACPKILAPVCGSDGNTYGNKCMARCAKVSVAYSGNCANPEGCIGIMCPAIYAPVCGADNVTYSSVCTASCTGVTIVSQGECGATPKPEEDDFNCVCPMIYAPVCGKDGKTYDNDCLAKCAKVPIAYRGKCADPAGCATVRCITEYAPVCGANGEEYRNECFAACTGVSYTPGPCKPAKGAQSTKAIKAAQPPPRKLVIRLQPPADRRQPPPQKARAAPPPSPVSRKVAASQCAACEQEPLAPVCGADGITYGNACLARCSGVAIANNQEACP